MPVWFPVAVLFFSSCLWGLSWWPMKQLAALGLSGVPLILVAYGTVGLAALPVLWQQRAQWVAHGRWLLAIVFFGGLANLSFAAALTVGDVIRVMALFYLLPVWGILGGRIFLGERLTVARVTAVISALSGAFLLLGGRTILESPPSPIDLLAILSGLAFSANNLLFRATPNLPVASKVGSMFTGCGIMAALLLAGGFEPFPAVPPSTLGLAVLFGLGGLLVATSMTQWAVTRLEAGRSAIIMVMELVAAVVSAALINGDTLDGWETAGATLILAAAVIEARTSA
jgi:drug/metabolite transporter (DMT)-like permease